jgi:hypothetical protein
MTMKINHISFFVAERAFTLCSNERKHILDTFGCETLNTVALIEKFSKS